MNFSKRIVLASCMLALGGVATAAHAEPTPFPLQPSIAMEPDGTLHFKDRTIPMPTFMSDEAKARYLQILNGHLKAVARPAPYPGMPGAGAAGGAPQQAPQQAGQQGRQGAQQAGPSFDGCSSVGGLAGAQKSYPVDCKDGSIDGVTVAILTPKDIPARNRNRVVLALNSNAIGPIVANVAQMKVIQFTGSGDGPKAVATVYRELLKTHKPQQVAFVGISGGCQLSGNTAAWLPEQKLPMPGALGLMTCAGGGVPGDTRISLDGLDPNLSGFTSFGAGRGTRGAGSPAPARPAPPAGEPPREIYNATIPKGFPPSYLLAGTRDLSLSLTVLLHRKLKNAGVTAELNIWEGMWHGFNFEPALPETREAAVDLAAFLDKHMAK